jgi:hypothetical protein
MSNQQEFLGFAEQCSQMAEEGEVAERRDALERMAHVWRQLAAEEERIEDLVRAVDQLFLPPVNPASPPNRGKARRGFIGQLAALAFSDDRRGRAN